MISIDDYNALNPVIASMIEKYNLQSKTIWFIDLRDYEAREMIQKFSQRGFIIGSHTMSHAFLNQIPENQAKWEIEESKKIIEKLTGKSCDWFSYPRGRYNDAVIDMVKKAGYKYARTTKLTDIGDYEIGGLHLTYPRTEYEGKDPFGMIKDYKHYWGHTSELYRYQLLEKFEKFLKEYK